MFVLSVGGKMVPKDCVCVCVVCVSSETEETSRNTVSRDGVRY